MSFISIFDVVGPNMVGPSSSHTAGAVKIAETAKKIFGNEIKKVKFKLYGSFARTYKGHGTDRALLGGIMGFSTDDLRIKDSFEIAKEIKLDYSFEIDENEKNVHPNTVDIYLQGNNLKQMIIRGVSIGGGKMKIVSINNFEINSMQDYLDAIENMK